MDYRPTHHCEALRKNDIGKTVTLSGWVHRRRDHGGLIFIDLRDRYGLTQVVFDPEKNPDAHATAEHIRMEYVITIRGEVISRREGMTNPNLATGEIEVAVQQIAVLSKAKTPPFPISDEQITVGEELRLRYRYLDIRRGDIIQKLTVRHRAMLSARNFLDKERFLEITTPILGKSTPEGARDYLVPSRIYPGSFYALPQSPQLFKQLLMIGGVDRYFQIATCFRDEDLRADRQPEFTQIDLEMSFQNPENLFVLMEKLLQQMFRDTLSIDIPAPFRRMTHRDCMEHYGTDRPDLRFDMPLIRIDTIAEKSDFSVFKEQIASGSIVKGIVVKNGAEISRRVIDEYTNFVAQFGVRGLAWIKRQEDGSLSSSIVKFFSESLQQELIAAMNCEPGDLMLFVAAPEDRTNQALDHLRRKIARDRKLINKNTFEFLWVTDFPLFTWNSDEERIVSEHHPFTALHPDDVHLLDSDPMRVRSLGYDIVLNGYEIGGGSQRIHDEKIQAKIFEILQLSPEEMRHRFGFFLDALQYGTPPHLGIAFGLDRIIMIMTDTENIRDVVAFPKTQKASDLMMEAPAPVSPEQLTELSIKLKTS